MYFLIKSKRICVAPATFKYRQPCEMSREDWSPPPLASSPHHTLGARDRSSQHANTNMAITNIKRHGRIKKKKKRNRKALWGWAGLGAKFCCVWLSKGTCQSCWSILLIREQPKPRNCHEAVRTAPALLFPQGLYATIALPNFFLISNISMH